MKLDFKHAYGCLAGVAIGDAMGMPVEFLSGDEIENIYGWVDRFVESPSEHPHSRFAPGSTGDDTGQTIAILHAYNDLGCLTRQSAAAELLRWEASVAEDDLAVIIGPSTRRSLQNLRLGMDPSGSGLQGVTNGAAMRAAPVGLANPGDPERACIEAVEASYPTHAAKPAIAGAAAVACAVSEALNPDSSLESILKAARWGAEQGRKFGRWSWATPLEGRIELAEQIVRDYADPRQAMRLICRYVGVDSIVSESVAAAFGIVLLAKGDPAQAVILGANIGGDTDTIAAIAGAVCGAWRGIDAVDPALLAQVEAVNHLNLDQEAQRMVAIANVKSKQGTGE